MNSVYRSRIKNFYELYFTDKQHDNWIRIINKYYKDSIQDPSNIEIYLHRMLNGGVLDKDAVKTIKESKNDNILLELTVFEEKKETAQNKSFIRKLSYVIKECINEIEKYSRILSHRKF